MVTDDFDERVDAALAGDAARKQEAQQREDALTAKREANEAAWERVSKSVVAPTLEDLAERLRSKGFQAVATRGPGVAELAFLPPGSRSTLAKVSSSELPRITFTIGSGVEAGPVSVHRSTMTSEREGQSGELMRLRFVEVTPERVTELVGNVVEQVFSGP